ncbi:hypothetical protein [uncultured Winogradskyella sp.]|uniref:hypothetical protein n=1 Tax=uncultured Winogradskyella sp. TaxID=395353 RepID=UPI002633809A|nr:hypothetical protein [uncultured Winogradskyella sp.]
MKNYLSLLFLFVLLSACEEIIEVGDISQEQVTILAPTNNSVLNPSTINFSWQSLEFAETYQLQIATPSFANASQIVEDTLISTTSFGKLLNQGNYEWRVKGLNSAYQTQYQIQAFTVEE